MTENLGGTAVPADAWAAEQGALLRGLAHALSNRVGTIVSAVGMLVPGAPAAAPIVDVLHDEGTRLEELLGLVRLLAGDAGDGDVPEPLHVPDLVRPLVALHAQHPDFRDVAVTIDETPVDAPALAAPNALARVLLLLLTAAKQGSASGVRVGCHARDGVIVLTIDGAPGIHATRSAPMLADGAGVHATETGYRIELPRFG